MSALKVRHREIVYDYLVRNHKKNWYIHWNNFVITLFAKTKLQKRHSCDVVCCDDYVSVHHTDGTVYSSLQQTIHYSDPDMFDKLSMFLNSLK